MKFVSPSHRGTTCQWRWSGMPAPATRPRFMPTLNPLGCRASRRIRTETLIRSEASVSSGSSISARSPTCLRGATIRCPGLYGYLLRITKARSLRVRMCTFSSSPTPGISQKMQPPSSSEVAADLMYSMRQGVQSRSIRRSPGRPPSRWPSTRAPPPRAPGTPRRPRLEPPCRTGRGRPPSPPRSPCPPPPG